MTKIRINFKLERPLDDELLSRISDAQAIYGIEWIRVPKSLQEIQVEYDASRLRPSEVAGALTRCGIPVELDKKEPAPLAS